MGQIRETFEQLKAQTADKVRKLLAKAEDPAATPEEAQIFAAKAQELMTRYSIDLSMIADAKRPDELVERSILVDGAHASARTALLNSICLTNDCRAVRYSLSKGFNVSVVGYAEDIEWVETLFRSLDTQLHTSLARDIKRKPTGVHGRSFSANYIGAFINAVGSRLRTARREAADKAEADRREAAQAAMAQPAAGPSVALVLKDKVGRVEAEYKVRHPHTRTVRRGVGSSRTYSGRNEGRAAGNAASLARGSVGGSRRSLR